MFCIENNKFCTLARMNHSVYLSTRHLYINIWTTDYNSNNSAPGGGRCASEVWDGNFLGKMTLVREWAKARSHFYDNLQKEWSFSRRRATRISTEKTTEWCRRTSAYVDRNENELKIKRNKTAVTKKNHYDIFNGSVRQRMVNTTVFDMNFGDLNGSLLSASYRDIVISYGLVCFYWVGESVL